MQRLKRKIYYDQKPFILGKPPNKQNNRSWGKSKEAVANRRTFPMDQNPATIHCLAAISWFGKAKLYWYMIKTKYKQGMRTFYANYVDCTVLVRVHISICISLC